MRRCRPWFSWRCTEPSRDSCQELLTSAQGKRSPQSFPQNKFLRCTPPSPGCGWSEPALAELRSSKDRNSRGSRARETNVSVRLRQKKLAQIFPRVVARSSPHRNLQSDRAESHASLLRSHPSSPQAAVPAWLLKGAQEWVASKTADDCRPIRVQIKHPTNSFGDEIQRTGIPKPNLRMQGIRLKVE